MAIINLKFLGVSHSTEGTTVSRAALKCMLNGLGALDNLLSHFNVALNEKVTFGDGEVLVNPGEPKQKALPMAQNALQTAVLETLGFVEEVKLRFGRAYKNHESINRNPAERMVFVFNKAAFDLAASDGHFVLLPGTAFERTYVPVDPRTLECPEPADSRVVQVEGAVVTGSRNADGGQTLLPFNGNVEIKALVSLQDEITEVLVPTTLAAGQTYWRNTTRMTGTIRVERGKIPVVIGDPVFVREEGEEEE